VLSSSLIAVARMRGLMSSARDSDRRPARDASLLSRVEKTVVAQMVVGVRDQDIEHHPPPQCRHVGFRRGPVLAQRVDNFQIASTFVVF